MTLRDDVRDYFEREARRVPAPSGLRADVTSRAISARPNGRSAIRWAAVAAALLAATIVIGLVATGAFRQSRGLPAGPPAPATPGTHGQVFDVSFANASDGWALLGVVVGDQGHISVEATHDGGATWLKPVLVGPAVSTATAADSLRHIHFVDRDNGFVWGAGPSFVTHDGGSTWSDSSLPHSLVAITGQEGVTWAVQGSFVVSVENSVQVSADGGKSWLKVTRPPFAIAAATSFGITGLLIEGYDPEILALTDDGGSTWHSISGPCTADYSAASAATTPDGHEIWEVCTPVPPFNTVPLVHPIASTLFVSEDAGRTWSRSTVNDGGVNTDWLLSPSPGNALLGTDTPTGMMISHDGGKEWSAVSTDAKHGSIGALSFSADGSVAVAVDSVFVVWISHDGGNTWKRTVGQP